MLEKMKVLPKILKNWSSSIEERELAREEVSLQEAAVLLTQVLTGDRRIPDTARALKRKYTLSPKEELPFLAYAQLFIPENTEYNVELYRIIFGRGTFRLYKRIPLKELASENSLSWRDCIRVYHQASLIAFDNQLLRAKFELTGKV